MSDVLHPCVECGADSHHRVLLPAPTISRPPFDETLLAVWRCPIHKRAWRARQRPRRLFRVVT